MSGIYQPIEIVAGVSPAAGVSANVPPDANRIRGDNYTNQWVHITGPLDKYVQPFQTGVSWGFALPFSRTTNITIAFEAPPGWNQAVIVSGQPCKFTMSADAADHEHDDSGFPGVSANIYVEHFEDNADPAHPYSARFYIPRSIMSVVSITLSYLALPYRYYTSASVAITETASGGGTFTSTLVAPGSTDAIGPGNTDAVAPGNTDAAAPGNSDAAAPGATDNATPVSSGPTGTTVVADGGSSAGTHAHSDPQGGATGTDAAPGFIFAISTTNAASTTHTHTVSHTHNHSATHVHAHTATHVHAHAATHVHAHTATHVHAHTATHQHQVTIPSHSHGDAAVVTMLPQIVEEATTPSWGLVVDGNVFSAPPLNALDIDILPVLTKDANGIPTVGWHSIAWTPATRTRLQADLVVQLLVAAGGLALGDVGFQPGAFQAGAFVGA